MDGRTKDYTVRAELLNYPENTYPSASTAEVESTIMFSVNDPCLGVSLSATGQTNPSTANYDSQDVVYNYSPYTATPDTCLVTTNCLSVTAVPDLGKSLPC